MIPDPAPRVILADTPAEIAEDCDEVIPIPDVDSMPLPEYSVLFRQTRTSLILCRAKQSASTAYNRAVVEAVNAATERDDPNWYRYLPWHWRIPGAG